MYLSRTVLRLCYLRHELCYLLLEMCSPRVFRKRCEFVSDAAGLILSALFAFCTSDSILIFLVSGNISLSCEMCWLQVFLVHFDLLVFSSSILSVLWSVFTVFQNPFAVFCCCCFHCQPNSVLKRVITSCVLEPPCAVTGSCSIDVICLCKCTCSPRVFQRLP